MQTPHRLFLTLAALDRGAKKHERRGTTIAMRVRSRVGSVAIAAVVIASSSSSSTAAPWKPTNATARKLAHDGASDFKRGDYEHAAEKLEAAWSVE